MNPSTLYLSLMQVIRQRFDTIATYKQLPPDYINAESAAFHGRKIVEATAFACLVAIENGLHSVPKDSKGKWNAEAIFKNLKSKGLNVLPSPSTIRATSPEEKRNNDAAAVIEGLPFQRLSHEDLIAIYQRLHTWVHEINPYVQATHVVFHKNNSPALWKDLDKLERFLERHFISINGSGFMCVLRDSHDDQTKVFPFSKTVS